MNYEQKMKQMNLLNNNHPNIITNNNNFYYSYNSHLNDFPFNAQMHMNNNNANINPLINNNMIGNNNDKFYTNRFPNFINNNSNYFRNKYINEYENNNFPNLYYIRNILLKEKYFLNNEYFMNNYYNDALAFNKRNLIRDFSSDFLFHRNRYDSHQILSQNIMNLNMPTFLPPPFKKRAYSHGIPFNMIQKYYDNNFIMEEENEEEGNNDDYKEGKIKNFKKEVNSKNISNNEDLNNELNDYEEHKIVNSKIKNDIPYKKINYENYNNYRYFNPYYQYIYSENIKSKSNEFFNQYKNINDQDNDIFFSPRINRSKYSKKCFNLKNLIYSKKNITTKSLINKKSNKVINNAENKFINNSVNDMDYIKESKNIDDISIKKELENSMMDKEKRIRMSEGINGKRGIKEIKLFKTKSEVNTSKEKILKDDNFGKQIKNDNNKNRKKRSSHKERIMNFQYIPSKEIIFTNSMYNNKTQNDNIYKKSKERALNTEKLKKIKTYIPNKKTELKGNNISLTYSKININNENQKKSSIENKLNKKKNRITFNDNIKIINLENKMNNSTEQSKINRIKSLQSLYNIIFTKKSKKIYDNKSAFDINKNKSINISKKLYNNCGEKKTNRIIWNINKKMKKNKSIGNDKDKKNIIKNKILIDNSLKKFNNSGDNIKPKNIVNIKFNTINKNINYNKNNDESYTNQYIQKTLSKVGNQMIKAKTQKTSIKNSKTKISKKANVNNSHFKNIKKKFKKVNISPNIDHQITVNEFPTIKTIEYLNNKSQNKKDKHYLFNINSSKQLKENNNYFRSLMINDNSITASDSDLLSKNRKTQYIENIKNKDSKIYIINKNKTEMKKKNNIIRNNKKKLDINELNIVTTIEVDFSKIKDKGQISKEKK